MKVVLIHNPDAGSDSQPSGDELARLIGDAGHSVLSQSSKHVDWQRVLEEPADLIAVAGGDGVVQFGKCSALNRENTRCFSSCSASALDRSSTPRVGGHLGTNSASKTAHRSWQGGQDSK